MHPAADPQGRYGGGAGAAAGLRLHRRSAEGAQRHAGGEPDGAGRTLCGRRPRRRRKPVRRWRRWAISCLELQLGCDRLRSRLMREENRKRLLTDGCIVAFDGWVPAVKLPKLAAWLDTLDCAYDAQRPHSGGDPRRAGAAPRQRADPLHELHHGAVLHARLRRRGSQPHDGPVLHLLFRHDDGGHGLRTG